MIEPPISAVILAGGAARRLGGGDKPLRTLAGKSIFCLLYTSDAADE